MDPIISQHQSKAFAALLFLAVLVTGCGGASRVAPAEPIVETAKSAQLSLFRAPEIDEIAVLEDARSTGDGRLVQLLSHADPRIRMRAALALGRMPLARYGAEITRPLVEALADADPRVRASVSFALGQRADPASTGALLNFWNDPDPSVRARLVEAASYLSDPAVQAEVLRSLSDESEDVVIEAVLAPHRWSPDAPNAAEVDRGLMTVLSRYPLMPAPPGSTEAPGKEIVWRTLFSLQRRNSIRGRGAYLEHFRSPDVRARIFSVKGLALVLELDEDEPAVDALVEACGDSDWRVVCEAARGLGARDSQAGAAALLRALDHSSAHVRREAATALGGQSSARKDVVPALWRASRDISAGAASAAVGSLVKLLPPDEAGKLVKTKSRDPDAVVRAGAATAASDLPGDRAMPILQELARDADLSVAGEAISAMGSFPIPARPILRELLTNKDRGLQLAAVMAMRESTQSGDLPSLLYALETVTGSHEDIAPELTFNLLENLGHIGNDRARDAVAGTLSHYDPYVRQVAQRVLRESFPGTQVPELREIPSPPVEVPLAGRDYPAQGQNPVVEIVTSRGTMVFELFPAEAPVHVYNFLRLIEAGYYKDLRFHRVVPDFVIQGGDYRGDGNGGRSWRGDSLRAEISPRKYVRGSLGMPRNENLESGGSQIFVAHRPTPHLDGRYTIFGELRSGFEVLDRVEVGDRILDVLVRQAN